METYTNIRGHRLLLSIYYNWHINRKVIVAKLEYVYITKTHTGSKPIIHTLGYWRTSTCKKIPENSNSFHSNSHLINKRKTKQSRTTPGKDCRGMQAQQHPKWRCTDNGCVHNQMLRRYLCARHWRQRAHRKAKEKAKENDSMQQTRAPWSANMEIDFKQSREKKERYKIVRNMIYNGWVYNIQN